MNGSKNAAGFSGRAQTTSGTLVVFSVSPCLRASGVNSDTSYLGSLLLDTAWWAYSSARAAGVAEIHAGLVGQLLQTGHHVRMLGLDIVTFADVGLQIVEGSPIFCSEYPPGFPSRPGVPVSDR